MVESRLQRIINDVNVSLTLKGLPTLVNAKYPLPDIKAYKYVRFSTIKSKKEKRNARNKEFSILNNLNSSWTQWRLINFSNGTREGSLNRGLSFHTNCQYINMSLNPSKLKKDDSMYVFRDNIKPLWDDPANTKGGRWMIACNRKNDDLLNLRFRTLLNKIVHEKFTYSEIISGISVIRRRGNYKIGIWINNRFDHKKVSQIGEEIAQINCLSYLKMYFVPHIASREHC